MENEKMNTAHKLFCIGFFALIFFLIFKYAFSALLPFLIAYAVSLIIVPISTRLSVKTKIPKKIYSAVLVTVIIALICLLIWWAFDRLIGELEALVERASRGESELVFSVSELFGRAGEIFSKNKLFEKISNIDGLKNIGDAVKGALQNASQNAIDTISAALPKAAARVIGKTPEFLIGALVTLISCYYLSMDNGSLGEELKRVIPKGVFSRLCRIVSLSRLAFIKYIKAYVLLLVITFVEVFIGLLILDVKYSFIIALIISVVDLLPVLGTGTVLIPWALCAFLIKDFALGSGLLVLYGILTIIRQIIEPKIVGTNLGIHPVLSLFSMYAGLRLFGFWGMILGPAAVLILSEMISGSEAVKNK